MNKVISFLLLLTFIISTASYSQRKKAKFEIRGWLTGFAGSTLIYLDDVDSSVIIHNRFHFTGHLLENAKQVLLRTSNFSDYKFFWLENSVITFKAEKGKFQDAVITGSKTQNMQTELDIAIKNTGKTKEQNIAFIRKNPNSIISAEILGIFASAWGKDTATSLYKTLSPNVKNTSYGKNIFEFITLNKNVMVGDKYVDFAEPDIEGKIVSLSDFKGKIVLLDFWASWCVPCREGNKELVRIYNEFKNNDFEILGVASDDKEKQWIEAVKQDSLIWQNVSDLKGDRNKAALIYGVSYYPTNYLIDKNGTIVARDLIGNALRNKLNELLGK
jgi:thiol-disulfide isomerase/thioredoxin